MSNDDQHVLDLLSSIADSIDRQIDTVAATLRGTLSSYKWIRETVLPSPPPRIRKVPPPPMRSIDVLYAWVAKNKILVGAICLSLGAGGYLVYQRRRKNGKKRRARRASNGARKEVVVIAGSPNEPVCRSLSLDLERRGFIVYMLVGSIEDEHTVQNESRADIRPLNIDITEPSDTESVVDRFSNYLSTPQHAFLGASPHNLNLAGFIVIPDTNYAAGPIETITPDIWSDALNVKILGTVATIQAFLRTINDFKARVLILTPNVIPTLSLPFHGVESAIFSALEAFTSTLRAELNPAGIQVCHFKLGSFDHAAGVISPGNGDRPGHAARADILTWPSVARTTYARSYLAQSATVKAQPIVRGSHLRELHNAVFDALTASRPRGIWHVGKGSLLYDIVGRWTPVGLVGWMMMGGLPQKDRHDHHLLGEISDDIDGGENEARKMEVGAVDWERV